MGSFANDKILDAVDVALSQNSDVIPLKTQLYLDVMATLTANNGSDTTFDSDEVDISENSVSIPSHSYTTGLKLRELTTTGTLPAGLSTSTVYYVIVVDDDNIKFATSQSDALSGSAVDITDSGSMGGVHTVVVETTIAGSIKLQKNDEPDAQTPIWNDIDDDEILNSTNFQNFSGTGRLNWVLRDITFYSLRAVVSTTSGRVLVTIRFNSKGF